MATHQSAEKRIRQTARRVAVNRIRKTGMREAVKAVELAIGSGDKKKARDAFNTAQSSLHRGVKHKLVEKNTAARKLSRLSARIKALKA